MKAPRSSLASLVGDGGRIDTILTWSKSADFDHVSIVSILPPSPTSDARELRGAFIESLEIWMRKIRKKRRHFVFCGDFGVAARTLDVEEWHQHNESPGFTKDDRHWLDHLLNDIGYVDAFREVFVNEPAYSWFPAAAGNQLYAGSLTKTSRKASTYPISFNR